MSWYDSGVFGYYRNIPVENFPYFRTSSSIQSSLGPFGYMQFISTSKHVFCVDQWIAFMTLASDICARGWHIFVGQGLFIEVEMSLWKCENEHFDQIMNFCKCTLYFFFFLIGFYSINADKIFFFLCFDIQQWLYSLSTYFRKLFSPKISFMTVFLLLLLWLLKLLTVQVIEKKNEFNYSLERMTGHKFKNTRFNG